MFAAGWDRSYKKMKRLGRKVISKTFKRIINTKTLLKLFSPQITGLLFPTLCQAVGLLPPLRSSSTTPITAGPWADETGANLGPGRKVFSFTSTLFSFRTELPKWWQRTHLPIRRHKRCRFDPWVRNIPWRRKWQPSPVFLPEKSGG